MQYDYAHIESMLNEIRESMRGQMKVFLKGTSQDNPHKCELNIGPMFSFSPIVVTEMFLYTENGNDLIVLVIDGDNIEFDDLWVGEQLHILKYLERKNNNGNYEN